MESPIRVLIVDDHQVLREGLRQMLDQEEDIKVIGDAPTGEQGIMQAEQFSPDVVLMDVEMPGMGGIEAVQRLKEKKPDVNVIMLTGYGDAFLADAIEAGAIGYILKDSDHIELCHAIRRAHQGQSPLASSITRPLVKEFASLAKEKRSQKSGLTERQLEILQLIADGATNKEVAEKLYISEATTRRELRNIFMKLNTNNRVEAVSEAYRRKLIKVQPSAKT